MKGMRILALLAAAQLAVAFTSYGAVPIKKKTVPAGKLSAKPAAKVVVQPHAKAAGVKPAPKTAARSRAYSSRYRAPARPVTQQAPTPERYKDIQQALADKGYFKGNADGQWNPDSVDALKRFQADQNLHSDGRLDSLSLIGLGLGPKRMTAQSTLPVDKQ